MWLLKNCDQDTICSERGILQYKNQLVCAPWLTNYVMEALFFLNDLKHVFDISVLTFLVTYGQTYMQIPVYQKFSNTGQALVSPVL